LSPPDPPKEGSKARDTRAGPLRSAFSGKGCDLWADRAPIDAGRQLLKILTPDGRATEGAALAGIRERATYVVQRPTRNNKEHKHQGDFAPETTMELVLVLGPELR
jgi:hypothetical protein